MIYDV
jgi:hypothetical protein